VKAKLKASTGLQGAAKVEKKPAPKPAAKAKATAKKK